MNLSIYNFFLFLIWLGVGLTFLVIGPIISPNSFKGTEREMLIGCGALVFALWNLMRLWMNWSLRKARQRMEDQYRERIGERATKDPPPVVNPEFKFEDPPGNPPTSNGKSH